VGVGGHFTGTQGRLRETAAKTFGELNYFLNLFWFAQQFYQPKHGSEGYTRIRGYLTQAAALLVQPASVYLFSSTNFQLFL
jgi:hypothetical protein